MTGSSLGERAYDLDVLGIVDNHGLVNSVDTNRIGNSSEFEGVNVSFLGESLIFKQFACDGRIAARITKRVFQRSYHADSLPLQKGFRALGAIEHLGPVVADVADRWIGGRGLHLVGVEGTQQIDGRFAVAHAERAARMSGQPARVVLRFEDDWHSVMNGRHQLVRLGSNDREALQPPAVWILPGIPESCECEGLAVGHSEAEGLLGLGVDLLPLVESVGGNNAAAALEGDAPSGALHDALGPGVDGGEAFEVLETLSKVRDQSPAQKNEFALTALATIADDGLVGRRGDVVIPRRQREVIDLCGVEGLSDLLFIGASVVAATHDLFTTTWSVKGADLLLGVFAGDIQRNALAQEEIVFDGDGSSYEFAERIGYLSLIEFPPASHFNIVQKHVEVDVFQVALELALGKQERPELDAIRHGSMVAADNLPLQLGVLILAEIDVDAASGPRLDAVLKLLKVGSLGVAASNKRTELVERREVDVSRFLANGRAAIHLDEVNNPIVVVLKVHKDLRHRRLLYGARIAKAYSEVKANTKVTSCGYSRGHNRLRFGGEMCR